jgi:hypothetical protein
VEVVSVRVSVVVVVPVGTVSVAPVPTGIVPVTGSVPVLFVPVGRVGWVDVPVGVSPGDMGARPGTTVNFTGALTASFWDRSTALATRT